MQTPFIERVFVFNTSAGPFSRLQCKANIEAVIYAWVSRYSDLMLSLEKNERASVTLDIIQPEHQQDVYDAYVLLSEMLQDVDSDNIIKCDYKTITPNITIIKLYLTR